jgi:hypothetical protein
MASILLQEAKQMMQQDSSTMHRQPTMHSRNKKKMNLQSWLILPTIHLFMVNNVNNIYKGSDVDK